MAGPALRCPRARSRAPGRWTAGGGGRTQEPRRRRARSQAPARWQPRAVPGLHRSLVLSQPPHSKSPQDCSFQSRIRSQALHFFLLWQLSTGEQAASLAVHAQPAMASRASTRTHTGPEESASVRTQLWQKPNKHKPQGGDTGHHGRPHSPRPNLWPDQDTLRCASRPHHGQDAGGLMPGAIPASRSSTARRRIAAGCC